MRKKVDKVFILLKILIILVFLILSLIIAFYKFPNQDVMMIVETSRGNIECIFDAMEIENYYDVNMGDSVSDEIITEFSLQYLNAYEMNISQIKFYRRFKSICVDKITSDQIDSCVIKQTDQLIFNANVCDKIKKISQSYVMERLIFVEILLIVVLFIWIILNALSEKINFKNNHGPVFEISRFGREILTYREYIFYAAKADLKAEVANSYLNRLWWILEPFFNMLVYVIVFGRIMGNSIQNYATYVFSALLMWNYFNHILNYSVKCIRNNRDIVTKIYMPKYVLLLTNMVLNFIKLLFSVAVLLVMMFIFKVEIGINIFWVIPPYVLMLLLSFGFGLILLHYGVFVDDLGYAVGILLTMVMFLSGIFYDVITTLTAPLNGIMLCANPVSMFTDTMRNALLYNSITNVPLVVIWLLLGLLIFYIGLHMVYKNENGYVKVI